VTGGVPGKTRFRGRPWRKKSGLGGAREAFRLGHFDFVGDLKSQDEPCGSWRANALSEANDSAAHSGQFSGFH
jgi:hypothetical protein